METEFRRKNFLYKEEGITPDDVIKFIINNAVRTSAYEEQISQAYRRAIDEIGRVNLYNCEGVLSLIRYILTQDHESRIHGATVEELSLNEQGLNVSVRPDYQSDIVIVPELWALSNLLSDNNSLSIPANFELKGADKPLVLRATGPYIPEVPITTNSRKVTFENLRATIPHIPADSRYVFRNSVGHVGHVGERTEIHAHNSRQGVQINTVGKGSTLYAEGESLISVENAPQGLATIVGYDNSSFKIHHYGSAGAESTTVMKGNCSLDLAEVMGNWFMNLEPGDYSLSVHKVTGKVYIPDETMGVARIPSERFVGLVSGNRSSLCCVDSSTVDLTAKRQTSFTNGNEFNYLILRMNPEYLSLNPIETTLQDRNGFSVGVYRTLRPSESFITYFRYGTPIVVGDSFSDAQQYLAKFPELFR